MKVLVLFFSEKSYKGNQERMCTVSGPSSQRFYLYIKPLSLNITKALLIIY